MMDLAATVTDRPCRTQLGFLPKPKVEIRINETVRASHGRNGRLQPIKSLFTGRGTGLTPQNCSQRGMVMRLAPASGMGTPLLQKSPLASRAIVTN